MRSNPNSPALTSLKIAVQNNYLSRKGRYQTNLYQVLKCDITSRNFNLTNIDELNVLSNISHDRECWRKAFSGDLFVTQADT